MEVVYFRTGDTFEPVEVVFDNRKISFTELGQLFRLKPESIRLNGSAFLGDSRSEWKKLKEFFSQRGRPVGATKDDPVTVTGDTDTAVPTLSLSHSKRLRIEGLEGGMQIGLESGMPVERDHPLSKFVACLQDSTLQERINSATSNSAIGLPKGIIWLGDKSNFSNQLFMRPCYFDLLEAKEEYFKLNNQLSAVVYTGTPGIGKSYLCAFVVARKLIAGTVVFFESSLTSDGNVVDMAVYRLHLAGGVHSVHRFKSSLVLDSVSRNENAVYIVDGCFPRFPNVEVEIQIFASPSKLLFRPKKKAWAQYLYLHTPLFDLEELYSLRSAVSTFEKVSRENVEEWFLAAGGVARTVLKRASEGVHLRDWRAEAREVISHMETGVVDSMIVGLQQGTFVPGSDSLFHWRVDETYVGEKGNSPEKPSMRRFKRKMLCFASDWVANEMFFEVAARKTPKCSVTDYEHEQGGRDISAARILV